MRRGLPQFGADCVPILRPALDRGKRLSAQVVRPRCRRTSGSVSTRRRGDAPCQLFRLRRYRRRPRMSRLPRPPWFASNPASSSRCSTVLPAPGVGRARTGRAPNRSRIDIHSFEFGRLHESRANHARAFELPDDALIRPHDAEIEFPLRRDQDHPLADDDDHRHVVGFA
jgi:hypothetical protein